MSVTTWIVVCLLSLGMVIAYIDRTSLSVVLALDEMKSTFGINDVTRGVLNSAFFWSYALLQIPAGWLVDRYGVKRLYTVGFLFWTLISALTGLATSVSQLLIARILLGAGESVGAPASLRWIRANCPEERRGLALGIYMAGTKIGSAVGTPLAAVLITIFDWRKMFIICGISGLAWLVAWLLLVKEQPREEMTMSTADTAEFMALMKRPLMFGILLGTFAYGYFLYFCVTWLPAYLVEYRHLPLNQMGLYTFLSFGGMALIAILGGSAADWMIRRGADPSRTRKGFTIAGFLLASSEVFGAMSHSQDVALFFTVFSLAGLGLATANYWALTQTLIPGKAMGRVAGIQNCASNLGGVAAPLITGWLKETSGGYQVPMQAIWIVLLIGVLAYAFLVRPEPLSRAQA